MQYLPVRQYTDVDSGPFIVNLEKHGERVSMTRTTLHALQGDYVYNNLLDSATTFAQPNVPSQNCPAKSLMLLFQYLLT